MTQYDSHLGPKTGRKLRKVTNIYVAKWQSSWAQDGMQVGIARTIEFGVLDSPYQMGNNLLRMFCV